MTPAKPDAAAIAAFLDDLARQPWLDEKQRQWPFYSFHITDLENAVSILQQGRLLSRSAAIAQGCLINDQASAEIIEGTDPKWYDYVRLYFRPRVPTFYDNEGFRPPETLPYSSAHCRMPVALLFGAGALLSTPGVLFSEGSLARRRRPAVGDDVAFLRRMPFDLIYHDRAFSPEERGEVVYRRHAEIMVPGALELDDHLEWIFFRSEAELETFYSLLESVGLGIPSFRCAVARPGNLFFRRWTFIERVTVTRHEIRIDFNPDTLTPGPFRIDMEFLAPDAGTLMASWGREGFFAQGARAIAVPPAVAGGAALFRVSLDGHLAYQNRLDLRGDAFVF